MLSFLWTYEGDLDEPTNRLPLESEGPDWSGTGTARYRDTIELVNDDHRRLISEMQQPDGTWSTFMTVDYRREKT